MPPAIITDTQLLRTFVHMSQKQFAKDVGLSQTTISRMETGVIRPTRRVRMKIVKWMERHNISANRRHGRIVVAVPETLYFDVRGQG